MQTIFCDRIQCIHNFYYKNPYISCDSPNYSTCTHPCPTIPLIKIDENSRTCLSYEENQLKKDEEIPI
jgi:hypothetical protein